MSVSTSHGPKHRGHNYSTTTPATILPSCSSCGTDRFLVFDEYVPYRIDPKSHQLFAGSASFTCTHCGRAGGQEVPADWAPPGWSWYS